MGTCPELDRPPQAQEVIDAVQGGDDGARFGDTCYSQSNGAHVAVDWKSLNISAQSGQRRKLVEAGRAT